MISVTRSQASKDAELARHKQEAIDKINTYAGQVRLKFITNLPGQDLIYKAKEEEALRYLTTDPAPLTLVDFPMISAEVGVSAPTAYELAQLWANLSVMWRVASGEIEARRLTAIASVSSATQKITVDNSISEGLNNLAEIG
jgi:hypothetical protein